jgi:hypothetical protein
MRLLHLHLYLTESVLRNLHRRLSGNLLMSCP